MKGAVSSGLVVNTDWRATTNDERQAENLERRSVVRLELGRQWPNFRLDFEYALSSTALCTVSGVYY